MRCTLKEIREGMDPKVTVCGGSPSVALLKDSMNDAVFERYNGFFRYRPTGQRLEWYGKHAPSRPAEALYDGKVYISGYPGGQLFVYDPARPWKSGPQGGVGATGREFNPSLLSQRVSVRR